jgi:hypothetical protein
MADNQVKNKLAERVKARTIARLGKCEVCALFASRELVFGSDGGDFLEKSRDRSKITKIPSAWPFEQLPAWHGTSAQRMHVTLRFAGLD